MVGETELLWVTKKKYHQSTGRVWNQASGRSQVGGDLDVEYGPEEGAPRRPGVLSRKAQIGDCSAALVSLARIDDNKLPSFFSEQTSPKPGALPSP